MTTHGGEGIISPFSTSVLDDDEWSSSRYDHFTTEEWAPGIHRIGCWVDPRADLNTIEKRKMSFPCQELNHGQARSLSLYRLSYPGSYLKAGADIK
jgi:hypothetical protein